MDQKLLYRQPHFLLRIAVTFGDPYGKFESFSVIVIRGNLFSVRVSFCITYILFGLEFVKACV